MSPEQAIVESLLAAMDENVTLLETLKGVSREEFMADPRQYLFAERCFQLAIQCLVDVALRLAADEGWPKPKDGAEALQLLGEKRVPPQDFVKKIGGIVAFRNILVHAYLHINRGIVHAKLAEVGDFREFARHILAYRPRAELGGIPSSKVAGGMPANAGGGPQLPRSPQPV